MKLLTILFIFMLVLAPTAAQSKSHRPPPPPPPTTLPGLPATPILSVRGLSEPGYIVPFWWSLTFWEEDLSVTSFSVYLEADPDVLLDTFSPTTAGLFYYADLTDVTPGVTYCWYVTATNSYGTSTSNTVCKVR
jgi:hypothetical protein